MEDEATGGVSPVVVRLIDDSNTHTKGEPGFAGGRDRDNHAPV